LSAPDVKERLSSQGGDPVASTPQAFAAFIAAELKKWSAVIRSANIQFE
jgi:tripartite-type tricarboxylate transporter receptor subunit TctC